MDSADEEAAGRQSLKYFAADADGHYSIDFHDS